MTNQPKTTTDPATADPETDPAVETAPVEIVQPLPVDAVSDDENLWLYANDKPVGINLDTLVPKLERAAAVMNDLTVFAAAVHREALRLRLPLTADIDELAVRKSVADERDKQLQDEAIRLKRLEQQIVRGAKPWAGVHFSLAPARLGAIV